MARLSLGAGVGMHLAVRYPERVRSLSLHSAWDKSDAYLKTVLHMWQALAASLPTIADVAADRSASRVGQQQLGGRIRSETHACRQGALYGDAARRPGDEDVGRAGEKTQQHPSAE